MNSNHQIHSHKGDSTFSGILIDYAFVIDHFHNDVNSLEILPGTSLASISCGSKSQKCALISATHEIILYVFFTT